MKTKNMKSIYGPIFAALALIGFSITASATVMNGELQFEDQWLDLESGAVADVFPQDPPPSQSDFNFAYNGNRSIHAVLFQNQGSGVQIAFLADQGFATVDWGDVLSSTFTSQLIDNPATNADTILLHTPEGNYFKVGNFQETSMAVAFQYQQLTAANTPGTLLLFGAVLSGLGFRSRSRSMQSKEV